MLLSYFNQAAQFDVPHDSTIWAKKYTEQQFYKLHCGFKKMEPYYIFK